MGSCLPVVPTDQGEHPRWCRPPAWGDTGPSPSAFSRPLTLGEKGTIRICTRGFIIGGGGLLTPLLFDVRVLAALNLNLTHI